MLPHPKIVWSPKYEVDIGPHVFPTVKYRRVHDRLLEKGIAIADDFVAPQPASWESLGRVHDEEYLERIRTGSLSPAEIFRLELPFSDELRDAMVLCCGGTVMALRRALEDGVCVHLGGGFHHAFADHGEGFCLLNDVGVGAAEILENTAGAASGAAPDEDGSTEAPDEGRARPVERVSVIDLDVHHGNGTAAIFADDDRVFTFSMHQERNYPPVKPPGDLDVPLPDGIEDAEYLELLDESLPRALDDHDPDVALYLAGADPYREDRLGGLSLTLEGLARRDERVLVSCRDAGVPVVVLPAGGYALRTEDTVSIHTRTVEIALGLRSR
ncbi:MAG: histone deacetylase [Gemmatimonadota bacterium]